AIVRSVDRDAIRASGEASQWRYRALLPLPENARTPPLQVGWTPLYAAPRLARAVGVRSLWIKDDGRNPTGSLKDRASALVLAVAAARDEAVITTASTGNAAAALAGLAASTGQRTVIFVPEAAPPAKIAQLLAYGARVLLIRGNYDAAYDLCLEATRAFGWYCRNTAYNPYTAEGKKTVAFEVAEQLGWRAPEWVVVPVGDGNIITGVYRGFQDLMALGWIERMPRLLAVQAEGSGAVYQAWMDGREEVEPVAAHTVADSIAADLPRDGRRALRAIRETRGACVAVSDGEILAAIPALARGSGVFAEPAAAAGYAGLRRAVAAGIVGPEAEVVLLVTGNGLKDVGSVRRSIPRPPVIEPDLTAVANEVRDRIT
ncbi:MAG TPA: threonine synthase, partial [Caldilineae bacterium]|nr:threonine synthase [Caldilineae bacterium]